MMTITVNKVAEGSKGKEHLGFPWFISEGISDALCLCYPEVKYV